MGKEREKEGQLHERERDPVSCANECLCLIRPNHCMTSIHVHVSVLVRGTCPYTCYSR